MGILVADAGYVKKALEQDMTIENKRILLIRPYKSMKRLATFWQLAVNLVNRSVHHARLLCLQMWYDQGI